MELCINQSTTEEQCSIAKLIDSIFTNAVEYSQSTYKSVFHYLMKSIYQSRFLAASPTVKRRTSKSPKKIKKKDKKSSHKLKSSDKASSVSSPKTPRKTSTSRPSSKSSKKSKDTPTSSRPSTSTGILTEHDDETSISNTPVSTQDEILMKLLKSIEVNF